MEQMKEIENHIAYEQLKTKYDRVALDYVIMSVDTEYEGEITHKNAIIEALQIINIRDAECFGEDYIVSLEEEKMKACPSNMEELLQLPDDDYYDNRLKKNRAFSKPDTIPYWYAFLEPPHGNSYLKKDFIEFNEALFPNKSHCEVYRWNDEFSNYFDAGKEWWGTGLWSVYDYLDRTMVIIGASLTD